MHLSCQIHSGKAMQVNPAQANALKQQIVDAVLAAEGDLATALESFCAWQIQRWSNASYTSQQKINLATEIFLTDGKIQGQSPLELFLAEHSELSEGDRQLILSWRNGFTGLFEILEQGNEAILLKNWMTAKDYTVCLKDHPQQQRLQRLQPTEILLSRLLPLAPSQWMLSGPIIFMGKLGIPKLAVAVSNFKDNHPNAVYADAPDLLAESWKSVASLHTEFMNVFGQVEVTFPVPDLQEKLDILQSQLSVNKLDSVGLDRDQSLEPLLDSSELAEVQSAASNSGGDTKAAKFLKSKQSLAMVIPRLEVPAVLKHSPRITVLSDERWGQVFLDNYEALISCLESYQGDLAAEDRKNLQIFLEKPECSAFVWARLLDQYPLQLQALLKNYLQDESFNIERDLSSLLESYGKPIEPKLPETASIPLHLHTLLQEAVKKVSVSMSKGRSKSLKKRGFESKTTSV